MTSANALRKKESGSTKRKYMTIATTQAQYGYIWQKYRPVILRLMMNAGDVPQQYTFSEHDFRQVLPKNRKSLAFIVFIHRSKALNNIRTSPLAHALLEILRQSKTAVALTEHSTYEILLDEKFVLHVRKSENPDDKDVTSSSRVSLECTVS